MHEEHEGIITVNFDELLNRVIGLLIGSESILRQVILVIAREEGNDEAIYFIYCLVYPGVMLKKTLTGSIKEIASLRSQ